jgi:hypothetical protein
MADTKLPEGTDSIIEGAGSGGGTGGTGRSGTTTQGGSTSSVGNSTGARTGTTDSASGTDALITGGGGSSGAASGGSASSGSSFGSGAASGGASSNGGATGSSDDSSQDDSSGKSGGVRGLISTAGTKARDEAANRARGFVGQGLTSSSATLGNIANIIEDTVEQIGERLGPQYADYARSASQTVQRYATTLENKDPDELVDDAREIIRKSPGVALAGAAIVGFGLVRLLKAGIEEGQNGTSNRTRDRAS